MASSAIDKLSKEELYRLIADSTHNWEEWLTPEGNYLYCSPACERITGYRPEEFIADTQLFQNIVHPEDRDAFSDHLRQVQTGECDGITMELRILHRDGSERWIRHSCEPVHDRRGKWLGQRGSNHDITDHKNNDIIRLQEELQRSRQQLQVILDGIADAILVLNKNARIIYANPAAAHAAGFQTTQELVEAGEMASDWIVMDEAGRYLDARQMPYRQALQGKTIPPTVLRHRRPDGSEERWSVVKAAPIFDANGDVLMAVYISHDITEIKRTHSALERTHADLERRIEERTAQLERANLELRNEIFMRVETQHTLKQERDFIESLIQTAQVGMLLLDPQGKIMRMNRYFEELTGYRMEEVQGMDGLELFIPERDHPSIRRIFIEALQDNSTRSQILQMVTREGQILQMEFYGKTLHNENEQAIGLLTIGQDVTERMLMEEELLQNISRAEALARVAARITAHLDLDAVLQAICEETLNALPFMQYSNVMLYDAKEDLFVIAASYGFQTEYLKQMASISGARYAEFRQASEANGPIMVIPDATLLPNVNVPRVPEEEQTRSIISIGLIHNEKMIGALNVATQGNIHIPSDKEQELVQAFANQAAVAIANAQLFEQVSASKQSLEMLSQRLVEIQEVERRYLARELHDEIGQLLTSLSLTLNILARESGDIQPSSRAEEELGRAQEVVSQLLKQVRELSLDLRPALLDDLGLLPALLSHFERYNAQTGIRVDFRHSGLEERCSGQVETTAFRIIQEALTNVARHAKVDEVAVRLWANEDTLGVQVEDEGIGFDPQAALQRGGTVGLSGMRERVALCGGHMEISSEPGSGTSLTAELPLNSRL